MTTKRNLVFLYSQNSKIQQLGNKRFSCCWVLFCFFYLFYSVTDENFS